MNLGRNIITTAITRVAMLGLALVSSVVLARVLGPEGRGLVALITLLPDFAQSFGLFGFDLANTVYVGLEPQSRRRIVWHSVALAFASGTILFLAGTAYLMLGAPGIHIRGPIWLYLLALSGVPVVLLVEYWSAIVRGLNEITLINVTDVSKRIASVVLLVGLVGLLKLGVFGAVLADWLFNIAVLAWLLVLLMRLRVWGPPVFEGALLRRTGRFAAPAYASNILSFLNYRVDQFVIAMLLPPEQLGFYAIAVGLAERIWIPTGAIATALLPHLTNDREHDPAVAAIIARHALIVTAAGCLGVWIFAGIGIKILYSSAFSAAVAPLRWLLPGILTLTVAKVVVAELNARRKLDFNVFLAAFAALLNIACNFLLIPRMGISGASLASTISYTVLSLGICWYYFHITGVSWMMLVPRKTDFLAYAALLRRDTTLFKHSLQQKSTREKTVQVHSASNTGG
jgi:O-antigen/teichoic acid export membrane protein